MPRELFDCCSAEGEQINISKVYRLRKQHIKTEVVMSILLNPKSANKQCPVSPFPWPQFPIKLFRRAERKQKGQTLPNAE
ncbi:hypothetical protein VTJ04DRAFT_5513 [Mycothermus thermophilus]|uniref:uncharacterized protein n=1 Tax=Humicola insolens TaxID=85995 RepID=UPI003744A2D8